MINTFSRNIFGGANSFINGAMLPFSEIPDNLTARDKWYTEFLDLEISSENVKLSMSDNRKWLNVGFTFKSNYLKQNKDEMIVKAIIKGLSEKMGRDVKGRRKQRKIRVSRLNTPAILTQSKKLKRAIAYIVEEPDGYEAPRGRFEFDIFKKVELVISRRALQQDGNTIAEELKKIFASIDRENNLLREDQASETNFVQPVEVSIDIVEGGDDMVNPDSVGVARMGSFPEEYWGMYRKRAFRLQGSQFFESPPFFPWHDQCKIDLGK